MRPMAPRPPDPPAVPAASATGVALVRAATSARPAIPLQRSTRFMWLPPLISLDGNLPPRARAAKRICATRRARAHRLLRQEQCLDFPALGARRGRCRAAIVVSWNAEG